MMDDENRAPGSCRACGEEPGVLRDVRDERDAIRRERDVLRLASTAASTALAVLTELVTLENQEDTYEPGGPLSWPPPGYTVRKAQAWAHARLLVKTSQEKGADA